MNPLALRPAGTPETSLPGGRSLDASDGFDEPVASPRYCPAGLLANFVLRMAGHGRCVDSGVMLHDREYAMWQLACARSTGDPELTAAATRLFPYFDDPQHSAVAVG